MNALQCLRRPAPRLRQASSLLLHSRGVSQQVSVNTPQPPSQPAGQKPPILRRDLDLSHLDTFPSLLHPMPYHDNTLTYDEPPSWATPNHLRVKINNTVRTFWPYNEEGKFVTAMEAQRVQDAIDDAKIDDPSGETGAIASLPRRFWGNRGELHRYRVFQRRAVHQTGKGKMSSMAALYIIGNGQGLVGWGQGKHVDPVPAIHEAHRNGFLNLDLVDRFEDRTIWHETVFKFGATEVHLRPRPLGFGLRTGPIMHQVCKAAGIKDISGKIRGSKNKMNVVKATCLALWASQARPHMGDGIGGPGRRSEKGQGIRSRDDIERARGRSLREL